jgi:hypothetical protein
LLTVLISFSSQILLQHTRMRVCNQNLKMELNLLFFFCFVNFLVCFLMLWVLAIIIWLWLYCLFSPVLLHIFFSFTCFLPEQIRLYNPRTAQPATVKTEAQSGRKWASIFHSWLSSIGRFWARTRPKPPDDQPYFK